MKQKLLLLFTLLSGLCASGIVLAYNQASVTASPATFGPQTNVKLTFSAPSASCSNGKSLFYLLQWFPDPKQSASQFINDGSGNSFTYSFSSATAGTMHKYAAVFYCSPSKLFGSPDGIRSQLNLLNQNEQWVAVFSDSTQQASNIPTVIYNPLPTQNYYTSNTRISITVDPVPTNVVRTTIYFNNNPFPVPSNFKNATYPFWTRSGEIENLKLDGSDNSIKIVMQDGQDNIIPLNHASLTFKVGNPPGGAQGPTGTQPGTNGNNDKLINPLPTDNLLATFLNIAKGFLAGIAIWAVIFIIVGGFRMVVAAGNEEAITVAKKTITWAILGLVIALLSFSIVAIVQNLLNVNVKDLNPGTINPSSYIQTKNIKT